MGAYDDIPLPKKRGAYDDIPLPPRAQQPSGVAGVVANTAKSLGYAGDAVAGVARNFNTGAVRELGRVGSNILRVGDAIDDVLGTASKPEAGQTLTPHEQRMRDINDVADSLGGDRNSIASHAGGLGVDIAATAGMGGLLTKGITTVAPAVANAAPGLMAAIESGGMTTGRSAPILVDLGTRAAGGAINGGASMLLIDPDNAGAGAVIGGALPVAVAGAGWRGKAAYRTVAPTSNRELLTRALDLTPQEAAAMATALDAAPAEILAGSPLTTSQALTAAGARNPSVSLLERTVRSTPGGSVLADKIEAQNVARLKALTDNGAQTYLGAPATVATDNGNAIGQLIRDQKIAQADEVRGLWKAAETAADAQGVRFAFPLADIKASAAKLGAGSGNVGQGAEVEKLLAEIDAIGPTATFSQLQNLRSSIGTMQSRLATAGGSKGAESSVLREIGDLLERRVDDAAGGVGMAGDNVTPEFVDGYKAARAGTRGLHTVYDVPKIAAIVDKEHGAPAYKMAGDEITKQVWHGGGGLPDDVETFLRTLTPENADAGRALLREHVMTDLAGKRTAGGNLSSDFAGTVEKRLPGLKAALSPAEYDAITAAAADVRNASKADAIAGLTGSDTQAKIATAINSGVMDKPAIKALASVLSFKGIGGENVREWAAKTATESNGKKLAAMLADPKVAAQVLKEMGVNAPPETLGAIIAANPRLSWIPRVAPQVAARENRE